MNNIENHNSFTIVEVVLNYSEAFIKYKYEMK
jgi:hypothetical protein